MNTEQISGIVRHALGAIGGYVISIGVVTTTEWETITGAILILSSVAWSMWEKRAKA